MAFRFLDLPQEILDNIYNKYFEGALITVAFHYDQSKTHQVQADTGLTYADRLFFPTIPRLNLELVCRKMCSDARRARSAALDRTLIVRGMGWQTEDIEALFNIKRYSWLHEHVTHVHFDHFLSRSEDFWGRFLNAFGQVKTFDLAIRFTSYGQVDLAEIVSLAVADQEGGRLKRLGIVSLAQVMHERYLEDYTVTGRTICTWRGWTSKEHMGCEFVYNVRTDGCKAIKIITRTTAEGTKVMECE